MVRITTCANIQVHIKPFTFEKNDYLGPQAHIDILFDLFYEIIHFDLSSLQIHFFLAFQILATIE